MPRARPSKPCVLPRKQRATHEQFQDTYHRIESIVSYDEIRHLVDETVRDVQRTCIDKRVGYAWSGGKDSQALRFVCERAGIDDCVLAITDLEYPEFLQWATDNMPPGLEVINTGLDLSWLAAHPDMLFPQDAATAAKWFHFVQHAAQDRFVRDRGIELMVLGRRAQDGNFMGRDNSGLYQKDGVWRFSPLQHWRHVDVLALCHYFHVPLPPIYDWPRGFRVGTGPWPARQWTNSIEHGWSECWQIDADVVRGAASRIPSAAAFMAARGLT